MRIRYFVFIAVFAVAVLVIGSLPALSVPAAAAASCPDVELLFARGTDQSPPLGSTGQAFADALGSRVASERSFETYAVNYPASSEWFAGGLEGIRDAAEHVIAMANTCPNTSMVLSGFSQGAAVMGFVTSAQVPEGIDPETVPKPLQPEVADHVSAVVLFGAPNQRAMDFLGQPMYGIGPQYQFKTIELCIPDDPVCSDGLNFDIHNYQYPDDTNLLNHGVEFTASHLGLSSAPTLPPAPEESPAQTPSGAGGP